MNNLSAAFITTNCNCTWEYSLSGCPQMSEMHQYAIGFDPYDEDEDSPMEVESNISLPGFSLNEENLFGGNHCRLSRKQYMASLGEDKISKLSSFAFKNQFPPDILTLEEKNAINHIFGKIVKEWPQDSNDNLGLLTGYSFYRELFEPVLRREYNVACNGPQTSQDKAIYQLNGLTSLTKKVIESLKLGTDQSSSLTYLIKEHVRGQFMGFVLNPTRSSKYEAKRDGLGAIPDQVTQSAKAYQVHHHQLQSYANLGANAYERAYWVGLPKPYTTNSLLRHKTS
ncbi:hypothetical protein L210DRAFT_3508016 [Boletus edulis BED1]|uniref:Uncharacterized protein n=1 Tax=Boletus edulis BED1 TaxID=1328754 RepID=A0AAD4G9F2_BOLED|nr:hypothetical protein L210DRAFT_3508016 [Boletus edulis BED1]